MLVLSRKIGERIIIGDGILLTILSVRGGQVRLGIDAPRSTAIRREELPKEYAEPRRAVPKPVSIVSPTERRSRIPTG